MALRARRPAAALFLATAALFWVAASARADVLFWNNFSEGPSSVAYATIDSSGGGALSLGTVPLEGPEGMAYDSVTNRLFVASRNSNEILAIDLGGGGASAFAAPGAPVEEPEGVAVDPATRLVYWINRKPGTIAWARLDGSEGGTLNTGGILVDGYVLAIDPAVGRVYWFQRNAGEEQIRYANTDGTGGGHLNSAGATTSIDSNGIVVDPAAGRVYWLNEEAGDVVSYAALDGSGGGDLAFGGSAYEEPYGLALDPSIGRLYWANYGAGADAGRAFGFADLAGGAGTVSIAAATVSHPQDPVVIKLPAASWAPAATRSQGSRALLECSQGEWGGDFPGSFVYRAPRSYAYQWTLNGAALEGAVADTLTATAPGSYACTVTATNQAGATASASTALTVKAAKLKLLLKTKKPQAKAGKLATIGLQALNQGDLRSKSSRICVKLTKNQRKALKQPKCRKIGKVTARARKTAKLKIKVKSTAKKGIYKVKLVPKGTGGKAIKAKLRVLG